MKLPGIQKKIISFSLVLLLIAVIDSIAQNLASRFSFGLKGGINTTIAYNVEPFSIITNFDGSAMEKTYSSFDKNLGSNYGLIAYFNLNSGVKIGFLPSVSVYNYGYNTLYSWSGSANTFYDITFNQMFNYTELPVVICYEFPGRKIIPYVQAGGFYGFTRLASSSVKYTFSDPIITEATEFIDETVYNNSRRYLKMNYGMTAGAGLLYRFEKSKLGIEAHANIGLLNLANIKNRYGANNLTGIYYDAPDNMKMFNFSINIVYIVSLSWVKRVKFSNFCT